MIWTIISGAIIGAVAKWIMPGKDPGGIFVTILLGIAGSWVGGFVGARLGLYAPGESAGFIMSTLGAVLLLVLYRVFGGRGSGKSNSAGA
jgi:uncharacterized membrane protein YeaQ/YmgE (transglycosylase-associated protein family)